MSTTLPGPRIASGLRALALGAVTGVMEITGDLNGVIHLDGGDITYAESSGAPGLSARLIGSKRLSMREWDGLLAQGRPGAEVGPLLVERGVITSDELSALLRSVILDAVIALAGALAEEQFDVSGRFTPRDGPLGGDMLRLNVESVWAEATRRARQWRPSQIILGSRPQLCDLGRPWAVLKREQWSLACEIDGLTSVGNLAWRTGSAIHDTVEWVSQLALAGLCRLPAATDSAPSDSARPAAPPMGDESPASAAHAGRPEPLPRRLPGTTAWIREDKGVRPGSVVLEFERAMAAPVTPVEPDLLRRVLAGLKRME